MLDWITLTCEGRNDITNDMDWRRQNIPRNGSHIVTCGDPRQVVNSQTRKKNVPKLQLHDPARRCLNLVTNPYTTA